MLINEGAFRSALVKQILNSWWNAFFIAKVQSLFDLSRRWHGESVRKDPHTRLKAQTKHLFPPFILLVEWPFSSWIQTTSNKWRSVFSFRWKQGTRFGKQPEQVMEGRSGECTKAREEPSAMESNMEPVPRAWVYFNFYFETNRRLDDFCSGLFNMVLPEATQRQYDEFNSCLAGGHRYCSVNFS